MKKRIGNDIHFTWHIYRKSGETQTPESFADKDVEVKLMSPLQRPVTIEDVSIATGVVTFSFKGKHQVTLGNYVAVLLENKGEDGMVTLDVVNAVTLVAHSYMEDDGDEGDVIEAESVELTSTINAGGGGGIEQQQADWAQTDASAVDFIKNKPDLDEYAMLHNPNRFTETQVIEDERYRATFTQQYIELRDKAIPSNPALRIAINGIYKVPNAGTINGVVWEETAASQIPAATTEENGLMSAEDKQKITDIEAVIPEQASPNNKLADKDFVNSSVATATATFRGAFNLVTDLHLSVSATHAQIATALATAIQTADNNDYCFVQIPTADATPTEIARIDRYKYDGTAWAYEYSLNNSGFTAAQWAALNSGITSGLVAKLSALPTNEELTQALGGKANTSDLAEVATTGSYNDLSDKPDLSAFITKSVNDLTNYYLKSETYTKNEVLQLIGTIQQFHYEVYPTLPQTGASNVLYLIGPTGSGSDKYEEYVYANNDWTKIGDTSIDLSGYVTTEALTTALADYVTSSALSTILSSYVNKDEIDDVPTANSKNLVTSGGVYGTTPSITNTDVESDLDFSDEGGNVLLRLSGGHIKTKNFNSAEPTDLMFLADVSACKYSGNLMHISFDDTNECLTALFSQRPNSIYDITFFDNLRTLHNTYGACFSCYVYVESLANVTNTYANEFQAAKSWLRWNFHTYNNQVYNENTSIKSDYDLGITRLLTMVGNDKDCLDHELRGNMWELSIANAQYVRDNTTHSSYIFFAKDAFSPSSGNYYLSEEQKTFVFNNGFLIDVKNRVLFIQTCARLDDDEKTAASKEYIAENIKWQKSCEVLNHERAFDNTRMSAFLDWAKNTMNFRFGFFDNIYKF